MITDMSRNGFAMAAYPFFAGAGAAAAGPPVALDCGRGAIGATCGGLISAESWNKNV
jgi:hypothetical protein